jgi:hypothetical protein
MAPPIIRVARLPPGVDEGAEQDGEDRGAPRNQGREVAGLDRGETVLVIQQVGQVVLEREHHRVEGRAQQDHEEVGAVGEKAEYIADAEGLVRGQLGVVAGASRLFVTVIDGHVDDEQDQARHHHQRAHPQGGVEAHLLGDARRKGHSEGAPDAGDPDLQPEGETEFLAHEPLGQHLAEHHDLGLGAESEQQPAQHHHLEFGGVRGQK